MQTGQQKVLSPLSCSWFAQKNIRNLLPKRKKRRDTDEKGKGDKGAAGEGTQS